MKTLTLPSMVVPFAAILAPDPALFDEARHKLEALMPPVMEILEPSPFIHTDYYTHEMGNALVKGFVSFLPWFRQDSLVQFKLSTRGIEWDFAFFDGIDVRRRINIDPGYVDLSKTVLATSKNFSHRVYLGSGVFAEVTLMFQARRWSTLPWTYPDFMTDRVQGFLSRCRSSLSQHANRSGGDFASFQTDHTCEPHKIVRQ